MGSNEIGTLVLDIGRWIAYAIGAYTLLHLPIQLRRWFAVSRLYGRVPWSLARHMVVYTQKNGALRFQVAMLWAMVLIFVVPIGINFIFADWLGVIRPFPNEARSMVAPAVILVVWQTERISGYILPPSVLFLGTSRDVNIHLVATLQRKLRPYRTVSLLAPQGHISAVHITAFAHNNLRTINVHEWRTVVHHLMDVVPIILVDTAVYSKYLEEELLRIRERGLNYKLISFSSAKTAGGAPSPDSGADTIMPAERLADMLSPRILRLLSQNTDASRRWRAQQEYNSMIRSVPRVLRYNSDVNATLTKAHYILHWAITNYLRDCKRTTMMGMAGRLLEDLQSAVSPADEERYLRNSRGLDEVKNISISALELAERTPGSQQTFNIANAHNKIGKCARFSKDWKNAITHLAKAIEILTRMKNDRHISSDQMGKICKELADAHFLLGEVYMGRYRTSMLPSDSGKAEINFRTSLALDQELGQDSAETSRRLRDLTSQ